MTFQFSHAALQERMAEGFPSGRVDEPTVRRLWWAALATLQEDILLPMEPDRGLWLAAPLPALYEPRLLERLQGWVWAPEELLHIHSPQASLLPPEQALSVQEANRNIDLPYKRFPLRKDDGQDPLLLLLTPQIQIALALNGQSAKRNLIMRSDPETLSDLLRILDNRLDIEDPSQATELRNALADLGQLRSSESIEQIFWLRLSERLASMAPSLTVQTLSEGSTKENKTSKDPSSELILLEALTHEVRTPLATIRTLIRLLLRRNDLPNEVINHLQDIDGECTEQIDRFGLIFNAAELHRQPLEESQLARTDLGAMLKLLYPAWNQQLERRGISLLLEITPDLPEVLSNSERLEPMLGGLLDRICRGLPSGARVLLKLAVAGQRLKLDIFSQTSNVDDSDEFPQMEKSEVGAVLSWNPETGSLELSQAATRQLFASLGGRLTHRRNSGLTVFFPIA